MQLERNLCAPSNTIGNAAHTALLLDRRSLHCLHARDDVVSEGAASCTGRN